MAEQAQTHFTVSEWSTIRDEMKALRRGTKQLVPVLEARNPKITPTQSATLVEDLDEAILNLLDFKVAIQHLTKNP